MAMLEQSKKSEREPVKSPITIPKLKQATKLSNDLDNMFAEPVQELEIEAPFARPIEFIREGE